MGELLGLHFLTLKLAKVDVLTNILVIRLNLCTNIISNFA